MVYLFASPATLEDLRTRALIVPVLFAGPPYIAYNYYVAWKKSSQDKALASKFSGTRDWDQKS